MSISEFSILTGGFLSLAMVIFHLKFYKLFDWKADFQKVQKRNHYIFYTIHLALFLLFIIFSIISFVYYKELASCTGLAFGITILYSLFWLWRAVWQIYYFKFPEGSSMPILHYILTLVFLLLFLSYLVPIILKLKI